MLFYFPAEIKLVDLRDAVEQWVRLLDDSPIDAVSLVQISLVGWKGKDRCQLRPKGGYAPYVIFDRYHDLANKPLNEWAPRLSSALSENHHKDVSRASEWFTHND